MTITIVHAEALEWLGGEPACSFDAFFADPPYGLSPDGIARTWDDIAALRASGKGKARRGFMGRAWDAGVPGPTLFREVLRVLKPGAPILAFGGTRTSHRLTGALEDAGALIVDTIAWLQGQAMPKSVDLGRVVDASWAGYGTALRPGFEPCVLAFKPREGTIVRNARTWGVGGLAIDATRLSRKGRPRRVVGGDKGRGTCYGEKRSSRADGTTDLGGWMPNVAVDEAAALEIDVQSGERPGGVAVQRNGGGGRIFNKAGFAGRARPDGGFNDTGGASRFFYVAKTSRWERDFGCDALPLRAPSEAVERDEDSAGIASGRAGAGRSGDGVRNHHPCLKPIKLTQQLARLILPPPRETPRRLLNLFAGSGSEAIGAERAGWDEIVCVEREAEYVPALTARVTRWSELPIGMALEDVQAASVVVDPAQLSLIGGAS